MITTRLIGGIGNQLFQSSMLLAFSKKYHVNYFLPEIVINPHVPGKSAYKFPGFVYSDQPHNLQEYKEKSFRYEPLPPMDNVCFNGYWQSWKYFDEYRNELLDAIGFAYKPNDAVSIHVRRGDYLNYPEHHPPITAEYLSKAIRFMRQRGYFQFKVFSDDIDWCKSQLPNSTMFEYIEGQDEMQDLIDASCCSMNIGSNSSFSWWAYYLNQNKSKIGVFPKKWFGPQLNHDISDLLPSNTVML